MNLIPTDILVIILKKVYEFKRDTRYIFSIIRVCKKFQKGVKLLLGLIEVDLSNDIYFYTQKWRKILDYDSSSKNTDNAFSNIKNINLSNCANAYYVLEKIKNIHTLNLSGLILKNDSSTFMDYITSKFINVTNLNLSGMNIFDGHEHLLKLSRLTNLQILNISNNFLSCNMGECLEKLTNIHTLNVLDIVVNEKNEFYKHISKMNNIRTLHIGLFFYSSDSSNVDKEKILNSIGNMSSLQTLHLKFQELENIKYFNKIPVIYLIDNIEGIEYVSENIVSLNLKYSKYCSNINDDLMEHIVKAKNLKTLILKNTKITDKSMKYISELNKITFLDLSGVENIKLNNDDICKLTNIKILNLKGTDINDFSLEYIKELKNLQNLNLSETKIGDYSMRYLNQMTSVTNLDLSSTRISNVSIKKYISKLMNIRILSLANLKITDIYIKNLCNLKNLQSLDLSNTKITDSSVKNFFEELKNLQNLNK